MARILHLKNAASYTGELTRIGPGTESANVLRGQYCAFDEAAAQSAQVGEEIDREGAPRPYFVDVTDSYEGELHYDFTEAGKLKPAKTTDDLAKRVKKDDTPTVETDDEEEAPPVVVKPKVAAKLPPAVPKTGQRVPRTR